MTTTRFVRFPLSHRFTVAADAPRASRRVRMLSGASDARRELLDRFGSGAIAALGARPWRTTPSWPWPSVGPDQLAGTLAEQLPGLVIHAAAAPRQAGRHRLSLLCHCDGSSVVVKLGDRSDGLENEAAALTLLDRDPLPGIATPRLVATGSIRPATTSEEIAYVVTQALGLDGQRPAVDVPLRTFEADLGARLAALPRPHDAADDAVPVHGDLAPWNLRRTSRGLALFDWEAAGWGAPGSDLAHYRRACAGQALTAST